MIKKCYSFRFRMYVCMYACMYVCTYVCMLLNPNPEFGAHNFDAGHWALVSALGSSC